ncbi:hypothetical protein BHM03_00035582 [Ensete ventricosum]|nr:hypothetical protein BHM03_00035582 [Ensete ventricosum]
MIERNTVSRTSAKTGRKLAGVDGHIKFVNVHFSYPSRPDVLIFNGLNLNIPSGKIVALVGGSGSGKSTVISLIERFYEPQRGQILLDGHDIKDLDLKWLRQQIGLVNQEPALFATSIRENILYGKDDATIDEIAQSAKLSEAINFIKHLPDRYETQVIDSDVRSVGERGVQLSGGQKQRIAISRAILKNPSILLLDEATSALDAESERSVQEALDRVMIGRTTVVVAHRLSTIRNADIIAVVQGGGIVETGTHDQLMSHPTSAYASLVKLQEAAHHQRPSPAEGPSIGRPLSFGGSFRSDKDSGSCYAPEANDVAKAKPVSLKKLYSMVRPDWIFGVLGTLGAFVAGAQMPLFALGVTQALVSYYMGWETTQREVKKIALLFCGGAVLTVFFHVIEHLNFGIMGERLTLRVRERMFGVGISVRYTHRSLACSLGLLLRRVSPSLLFIYHALQKLFMRGYGGNLSKTYLKANMLAAEAVSNIRTVAAFCSEQKVIDLYVEELREPSRRSFRRGQTAGIFYGVSQCFLFSSYGSVLMGKGLASFKSVMKSFMVLIVTALAMGETLALAPDIIKGNQMAASVFEVLDRRTEVRPEVGEDVGRVEGAIEMRGVEFCYPSRPDVLIFRGFDLRVKAGKSMALVGMSGSGKSTVLALILRFYDATAGKVMIDGLLVSSQLLFLLSFLFGLQLLSKRVWFAGKDIRRLRLKELRKHIGLVQQEPMLFATTIYDNIVYGKDGATEAEVVEAAKLANAHSFISALPEGYSTKAGERGIQLSGGQKQRIAIARAIIKNPAILLLDEATSALDVESERVVQRALERVMRNRTTVMVAHRLSTIHNADVISVLQDGRIVEQGSHSALVENRDGAYFKLISLQQKR